MRNDQRAAMARVATALLAMTLVSCAAALVGCKGPDMPNLEKRGAVETTGTVQAALPQTTTATGTITATGTVAPGSGIPKGPWPEKVGLFAVNVKFPTWYPSNIPAGYKVESLDVVEMDKGTGLVCDMVFLKGDSVLSFTQGSPKNRDYAVKSIGKTQWGAEQADIVHEDPADPTTKKMIVFAKDGTFCEVSGDVSFAEMQAFAASMMPVK